MINPDADYWKNRYSLGTTTWDIGEVSTPLKNYFDQLSDKEIHILIPGCGNGYEAEYLFYSGFKNITVIDFANEPLMELSKRVPGFPKDKLTCGDFFQHHGIYDLIIEQTFYCAINPIQRENYLKKMNSLLKTGGKLVGLLFEGYFDQPGPPFGGTIVEYRSAFEAWFSLTCFELCYNSIQPRAGREIFINCLKTN